MQILTNQTAVLKSRVKEKGLAPFSRKKARKDCQDFGDKLKAEVATLNHTPLQASNAHPCPPTSHCSLSDWSMD